MLAVGQILYGYCGGYFDRDSYDNKRIEAFGVDWIVAREIDSNKVFFATFDTSQEMIDFVKMWSVDNSEN